VFGIKRLEFENGEFGVWGDDVGFHGLFFVLRRNGLCFLFFLLPTEE
jgi:hypothetical protein